MILLYLLIGALAGCITGFFGGGAGMVIVPALVFSLATIQFDHAQTMHIALGTGFAITSAMGILSCISHHKNKTVNWHIVKKLAFSFFIFCILGTLIANKLPSHFLIKLFGAVVLLLVFWILFAKEPTEIKQPNRFSATAMSAFIGISCGSLCVNPFTLSYLRKLGLAMHEAVATTLILGTILGVVGTLMFIINGWHTAGLPAHSLGYVDLELFLPFAIACCIFAPIAAKLSKHIPNSVLKYSYCILLTVIGLKMLV